MKKSKEIFVEQFIHYAIKIKTSNNYKYVRKLSKLNEKYKNEDYYAEVLNEFMDSDDYETASIAANNAMKCDINREKAIKILEENLCKSDEDNTISTEIDELFEMLSWDSDEGAEKGKNVKHLSIFIRKTGKDTWENCAKILVEKSDEALKPYLLSLLEWLEDANWPGFILIYNRIKSMLAELIKSEYSYTINKAKKLKSKNWIINLAGLARNKELYESLERKERKIIKKVFHKEKDWMEVLDDWNYVQ